MGSMASTVASIIFESCTFAALTRTASGCRGVDHKMALRALFAAIRWVLARFLAPRGRNRGGVQRGPVPVDAIGLGQLFEKHLVQPAPDARLVPVSQPAPARHPAPTPHLGR